MGVGPFFRSGDLWVGFGCAEVTWAQVNSSSLSLQVNMVIGILVFNKLVSKDGITDLKLKERAG